MIVLVTGTGTEVGKTWVTAAVARLLRGARHRRAGPQARAVVRPRATRHRRGRARRRDRRRPRKRVCPRAPLVPVAMAPPMAAELLDRPPFTVADLAAELPAPTRGVVLVEGAGGVRSPLATDGDTADLAAALRTRARRARRRRRPRHDQPGAPQCRRARGPRGLVVFLNRFDRAVDLHRRNLDWLRTREGLEVETDPEALALRLEALISR